MRFEPPFTVIKAIHGFGQIIHFRVEDSLSQVMCDVNCRPTDEESEQAAQLICDALNERFGKREKPN